MTQLSQLKKKLERLKIETIHSNLDSAICWIEHLADGQDSESRRKRPIVVYKADNQGAEIFGKVVEKGRHGKLYTITIRDYGIFLVTKEVYDTVKVGDEVML